MLLYRYFGSHAEETIEKGLMKVAKPSSLNDPFEFMFKTVGKMTAQKASKIFAESLVDGKTRMSVFQKSGARTQPEFNRWLKKNRPGMIRRIVDQHPEANQAYRRAILQERDETIRVISFTSTLTTDPSEILMWSHYADKHAGVRLTFELPEKMQDFQWAEVKYRTAYVQLDTTHGPNDAFQSALTNAMGTKCQIWSYEREYRLFVLSKACVSRNNMDFVRFDASDLIKRVDLGARYPEARKESFLKILKTHCPEAEVYAASVDESGYNLIYKRIL